MQINFTIEEKRAPEVLAAILAVHPKPDNPEDPRYVCGQTDEAWAQRVLRRRFRSLLTGIMKTAGHIRAPVPNALQWIEDGPK